MSTTLTEPTEDWRGGWWRHARRCDSPNFGPRPLHVAIDLVVIHSISLPPGEYGTPHVEALFTNRLDWDAHPYFEHLRGVQVSSHFFVRRDGEVVQFVDAQARAWHAGQSRWRGRQGCNDASVGIELEGLEGLLFEPAQYAATVRLCQALRQRFPVVDIAGHEHIAPGRKHDPGPGFDWAFLQQQLAWPDRCFPGYLDTPDPASARDGPPHRRLPEESIKTDFQSKSKRDCSFD